MIQSAETTTVDTPVTITLFVHDKFFERVPNARIAFQTTLGYATVAFTDPSGMATFTYSLPGPLASITTD